MRRVVFAAGTLCLTLTVVTAAEAPENPQSLIARSKVWFPTDIASLNLKTGPTDPGHFEPGATVTCDYVDKKMSGASPKFACRLPEGDEIKVKYGGTNGEVYGEVAASRLLWALGFGADRMYSVRVVCKGCPKEVGGVLSGTDEHTFDPAVIERKMPGTELLNQWDWEKLDDIDETAGGATKSHRDALKLLAVLLQHTDNKSKQQRLLCLDAPADEGDRCETPMMMLNDVGLTFGRANRFNRQPRGSVNLAEWSQVPIWKHETRCVGKLSGSLTGTLKDPVISEEGRRLLAELLTQLSDDQLRDMFDAARVQLRLRDPGKAKSGYPAVDEWVTAFKQKRAQIVDRRCAA